MRQVGMAMTLRVLGASRQANLQMIEGSHLFPMERPQETAAAIARQLQTW